MLEFPRVRRFTGRSEERAINAEPLRDILFAREEELLPSLEDGRRAKNGVNARYVIGPGSKT